LTSRSEGLLADGPEVRVWDLPTRLFHWLLLAGVTTSFITVKLGGNAMIWHGRAGTFVLSLLVFRVLWGFIGSPTARFANFVKGPKAIWLYLRGVSPKHLTLGHNPLGALSVVALLGLFLFQALTGLGTSDDIFFDGPLVKDLSSETVSLITSLHKSTEPFLLSLVGLHITAIVFYRLAKNTNLVTPMITGHKVIKDFDREPFDLSLKPNQPFGIQEGPVTWAKAALCWAVAWALVLSVY